MTEDHSVGVGYGARIVPVDTLRRSSLREVDTSASEPEPLRIGRPVLSPGVVADRLALAHWPWGHQIVVCSLGGGVGRTTVSGLLATALAELPYAHIWPPIALHETSTRPLSPTPRRWDLVSTDDSLSELCTRSGAWAFTTGQRPAQREDFSVIVVDATAGLPCDQEPVSGDPAASVVLVVRPDRASLAEAAEALVWMHDRHLVPRQRIVALINDGVGRSDAGSRAAATGLWTRCVAVHRLPFHSTLGPGRVLPSGHDLPTRLRRVLQRTALDLWGTAVARSPIGCNPLNQGALS